MCVPHGLETYHATATLMIAPSSRNTSNLKAKRFIEMGCRLSAFGCQL